MPATLTELEWRVAESEKRAEEQEKRLARLERKVRSLEDRAHIASKRLKKADPDAQAIGKQAAGLADEIRDLTGKKPRPK